MICARTVTSCCRMSAAEAFSGLPASASPVTTAICRSIAVPTCRSCGDTVSLSARSGTAFLMLLTAFVTEFATAPERPLGSVPSARDCKALRARKICACTFCSSCNWRYRLCASVGTAALYAVASFIEACNWRMFCRIC